MVDKVEKRTGIQGRYEEKYKRLWKTEPGIERDAADTVVGKQEQRHISIE